MIEESSKKMGVEGKEIVVISQQESITKNDVPMKLTSDALTLHFVEDGKPQTQDLFEVVD